MVALRREPGRSSRRSAMRISHPFRLSTIPPTSASSSSSSSTPSSAMKPAVFTKTTTTPVIVTRSVVPFVPISVSVVVVSRSVVLISKVSRTTPVPVSVPTPIVFPSSVSISVSISIFFWSVFRRSSRRSSRWAIFLHGRPRPRRRSWLALWGLLFVFITTATW